MYYVPKFKERKSMIMAKEKKTKIGLIEKYLGLVTTIVTLLGIVFTGIFKGASYYYEKGYYDYWKIPEKYMEIDYFKVLMQFLNTFSVVLFIYTIGLIYVKIYDVVGRLWKVIMHIIPIILNWVIILCMIWKLEGSLSYSLNLGNREVLFTYIVIEIFLYIPEIILLHLFKSKEKKDIIKDVRKDSKNKNNTNDNLIDNAKQDETKKGKQKRNKEKSNNNKVIIIIIFIMIVYIIGVLFISCKYLYNTRKSNCININNFEVIEDEIGHQYVVLAIYNNKYFAKPCIVLHEHNKIVINLDKYKFMELDNNEVIMYDFSNHINVHICYNNDEFLEFNYLR